MASGVITRLNSPIVLQSVDLNDVKKNGIYALSYNNTNVPSNGTWSGLIVLGNENDYVQQICVNHSGVHYSRALFQNIWTGWQ